MAKNKIDLFKADKAMAERVSKFMNAKVWGIVFRKRAEQDIKAFEGSIEAKKRLEGSTLWEKAQADIASLEADIVSTKEALKKNIEENATFDYTEADNAFYKSYKEAESDAAVVEAVEAWFRGYKLEVAGTDFLADIIHAISGERKAGAGVIIKSGATQFTIAKRAKNDVLCVFYGKLSEKMLEAGTLKATEIPEDIRAMYAPKKKSENKTEATA